MKKEKHEGGNCKCSKKFMRGSVLNGIFKLHGCVEVEINNFGCLNKKKNF